MFYANGAKLLRLSTIGILQYITPTMVFLIAVWLFGEPFEGATSASPDDLAGAGDLFGNADLFRPCPPPCGPDGSQPAPRIGTRCGAGKGPHPALDRACLLVVWYGGMLLAFWLIDRQIDEPASPKAAARRPSP